MGKKASVPANVLAILDVPSEKRTEAQQNEIRKFYRSAVSPARSGPTRTMTAGWTDTSTTGNIMRVSPLALRWLRPRPTLRLPGAASAAKWEAHRSVALMGTPNSRS